MDHSDKHDYPLHLKRSFAAPRERVFQAWLEPDELLQWSGPSDCPVIETQLDTSPGGIWRSTLQSTETGETFQQSGVYKTIQLPDELAFTFGWEIPNVPRFEAVVRLVFTEEANITTMSFYQSPCHSEESRDSHREGWEDSFQRLFEYLKLR